MEMLMFVGWGRGRFAAVAMVAVFFWTAPTAAQQSPVGVIDPAALELEDLSPGFLGLYRKVMEIEDRIGTHAATYGLDYDLARAVCLYESGGNARLTSWAGAEPPPLMSQQNWSIAATPPARLALPGEAPSGRSSL